MTLTRRVRSFIDQKRLIDHQWKLLSLAGRKLIEQEEAIDDRIAALKLEHFREVQGMAAAWLISLEQPELDIRDDLAALERKLGIQIAKLEEHIL